MKVIDLEAAVADALRTALADEIDGLQVYPYGPLSNPTPPALDIWPGDPFQTGAGFGVGSSRVWLNVRARVSTADQESAHKLLLRMLDPNDPASVEAAIQDLVAVDPDGVTGFLEYPQSTDPNGSLLGCQWRVSTFL